jgi:hypothetical protein
MALIRTGPEISDIRGKLGGVCFTRDRSGLHCSASPRHIYRRTPAQSIQRSAFSRARSVAKTNRHVSYLIYLALNNMPFLYDAFVTGYSDPYCLGKFVIAGTYFGTVFYRHVSLQWDLWYIESLDWWVISHEVDVFAYPYWLNVNGIEGRYWAGPQASGVPIVKLEIQPPPVSYAQLR